MNDLRSIQIDFDIHKLIETNRRSFDETEIDVLRRLLGIESRQSSIDRGPTKTAAEGRAWAGKGVTLPHGTELKMEYNGKVFNGRIEQGGWLVEGTRAKSPSDAACSVATTKDGKRPSLNGWNYWQVKRPEDRFWTTISSLRS